MFDFVNHWISDAIYITVAAMWLVPDKRIESRLKAERAERVKAMMPQAG